MRRFAPRLFAQVFCVCLVLFCVSNSHAQIRGRLAQQQIQNREWALENLRRQARLQPNTRQKRVDQISVRNDFRQLQITNNSLMAQFFESPESERISNKEIRARLGEMKKLAKRLWSTLGLPEAASGAEPDIALPDGLRQLDQAVMSFVDNPLFQQPRVFDAEMASRAAVDLSAVVRLTDVLRKLAKDD